MHLVVVAMVTVVAIVLHVVRRGAVVTTRTEPVRGLALERLVLHRVVMAVRALHTVRALVAARTSLAHVL